MKNLETPGKKHLGKIFDDIREGAYLIPDFQREFEWEPWDIVDLIRSIFMDYYIGTPLFWKASENNKKLLNCEPIRGWKPSGIVKPQHIVLDGQQRLTALYFAFFGPDVDYPGRTKSCQFFLRVDKLIEEDYDNAFFYEWKTRKISKLLAEPELQFKQKIMPLSIVGRDHYGFIDWTRAYEEYWITCGLDKSKVRKEAQRLQDTLRELINDYYLSYIELDRDISISKVCDIFTKLNSRGVLLNIFDLLNAILRPHGIQLKEMWRSTFDDLEFADSEKMKIYVLMVMSILKQGYCSGKYLYFLVPGAKKTIRSKDYGMQNEEIVLVSEADEFRNLWTEAVEAIRQSIQALSNPRDFGVINPKFLPYQSMIPVFSAIRRYVKKVDLPNRPSVEHKIKRWYWASIFTQNYSSSVESQSTRDFYNLIEWFRNDEATPEKVAQFESDMNSIDLKGEVRQGTAIYNAVFTILILNEARDWKSFSLPEYESLDDHHIVPYSWGKNVVGNHINSILNKTPLSQETNRQVINDEMPSLYLKSMFDMHGEQAVYELLSSHLISKKAVSILLRENFGRDDYYEFIDERRRTILDAIQKLTTKQTSDALSSYLSLIQAGENSVVEFKSTMVWNIKSKQKDSEIERSVLKTISAFLNSKGGTMFIGIDDTGKPVGLDLDLKVVQKNNLDGFELHFRNMVEKAIGNAVWSYIHTQMIDLEGNNVFTIQIDPSNQPVFTKTDKGEEFFIRTGNATKSLGLREVNGYISERFR